MLPPLVLLHGFTQTRQSWRRTATQLTSRYRVLTPDLPGHGQAAHRTPSCDAVTAYLRALTPSTPFTLVGYSMGGRIALHAAFQLDLDRLVLIGASPGIADPAEHEQRRRADEALAAKIEEIGVEAFAREWGNLPLFAGQPERVRAAAYADRLRNTPHGLAQALRGLGTGTMEPLWDRLPQLQTPVTLITGERDEKFRALAEDMARRLPNAEHVTIPNTGHAPQLEDPAAVAHQLGSPSSSASA
ncbi:2-succinyl-6-hydroxy-2,4-cyclohexadiene-1-carboxylate synthase [Solirubrobacter sp. CPCC 204708]|uniref:Putative 2-succinyl-6-hydroxy-2,4-cyclohexadiene-1-carboxylate synthase n=1 Tax=Solirubrobacter deserti TaxID=2282478 RepID=A0ABT4RNS5_9ACTN|nr:2-succinyl-6-hydroxy-2,4-cyclohexadiene-1-carboxylate synthase [Solirubrobacter deserti]MBE2315030.1 2-succinyl-6-hydroxy-2,4-cyclohexadiene-1-carboxylate synthase [Solirubrobacter deserti]MDA0139945.1 2-succinyl-6-hydroxy-2,4-cyclohexadiene-1-carboxylate synthase [Solirubrobacter deserti]